MGIHHHQAVVFTIFTDGLFGIQDQVLEPGLIKECIVLPSIDKCKDQDQGDQRDSHVFDRFFKIRQVAKYKEQEEGEEDFTVETSEQAIESFKAILGGVQTALAGIAAISLIVGGIGIMTTMYTAVIERTKEIGLMKAVGARNSSILSLFIVESGLIGTVGGALGIALGIGMAKTGQYIANYFDVGLKASTNPVLIFGALFFAFAVGTISGLVPARTASKLKPVDALRFK